MAKPSSRSRQSRVGGIRPKKRIRKFLLIVEGETTETAYARFIQSSIAGQNVEITPIAPGSARSTLFSRATLELDALVKEAKKLLKSEGRKSEATNPNHKLISQEVGEAWVVCDVDDEAETIKNLRPVAEHQRVTNDLNDSSPSIRWAVSNPCFEVWLIWHFEDFSDPGQRSIVQKRCREKELLSGANGKVLDHSRLTLEGVDAATARAKSLRARHSGVSEFPNDVPSSDMDLLLGAVRSQ